MTWRDGAFWLFLLVAVTLIVLGVLGGGDLNDIEQRSPLTTVEDTGRV